MTLTPNDIENQVFRERRRGYDPEEVDRFLDDVAGSIAGLTRERDRANARIAELEESSASARESESLLRRTLLTAERTAEQTVADARDEAERLLDEARRQSAELLDHAETEASNLRLGAEEQATAVRRDAEEYAAEMRRDAEEYATEMRHAAEEHAADMRHAAEEHATALRRDAEAQAAEIRRDAEQELADEREVARVGADHVRRAIAELRDFREEYRDRVQNVIAEQLSALERVGDLPELDPALDQAAALTAETYAPDPSTSSQLH